MEKIINLKLKHLSALIQNEKKRKEKQVLCIDMYYEHIFITAVYDVEEPFSRIIISQERVGKASQLEKVYVPMVP